MAADITNRLGGARSSLAFKAPCRAATTGNITLYGTQNVDGVAVVSQDRVLVKSQTDQTENGIWVVRTTAWTRARDFDDSGDAVTGTQVYVHAGTQAGVWAVSTDSAIAIGTTAIEWEQLWEEPDNTSDPLNFLDYGAVGNDSADNTTAWDLFIADIAATGRRGYVPAGTYRVTTGKSVSVSSLGFWLYGDGAASVIKRTTNETNALLELTGGKPQVHDICLEYANASTTASGDHIALRFTTCDGAVASGVCVDGAWYVGMETRDGHGDRIEGCRATGCTNRGMYLTGLSRGSDQCSIVNPVIDGEGTTTYGINFNGFAVATITNAVVVGGTIKRCTHQGIAIGDRTTGFALSGTVIDTVSNAAGVGVLVQINGAANYATKGAITGVTVIGATTGVQLIQCQHVTLTGCSISGFASGIGTNGASNVLISDNLLYSTTNSAYGILHQVDGSGSGTSQTTTRDNRIRLTGTGTTGIYDDATCATMVYETNDVSATTPYSLASTTPRGIRSDGTEFAPLQSGGKSLGAATRPFADLFLGSGSDTTTVATVSGSGSNSRLTLGLNSSNVEFKTANSVNMSFGINAATHFVITASNVSFGVPIASPTLTTPILGVATATSINKVALTAPATAATLTIADGKTLTASNTLTLAGTDSTTMTFPASSTAVAGLGIAQTFTAKQIVSASSASDYAAQLINTSATSPNGLNIGLTGVSGGSGANFLVCSDNANRLLIAGNGNVTNTNNSYGAISSIAYKRNVSSTDDKLDGVRRVRVVDYQLTEEFDTSGDRLMGVLAEELAGVFPDLVEVRPDGLKSVKYSLFVPILLKAVQELADKVDRLSGGSRDEAVH